MSYPDLSKYTDAEIAMVLQEIRAYKNPEAADDDISGAEFVLALLARSASRIADLEAALRDHQWDAAMDRNDEMFCSDCQAYPPTHKPDCRMTKLLSS